VAWKAKARAAQLPDDATTAQQLSSEELRRLRALGYVGGTTTPTRPAATNAVGTTNVDTDATATKPDGAK